MEKQYKKDENELGVLWEKQTATGNKWFSGILEIDGQKINIVVFSNNGKSEKAPTHRILKSKPRENKEEVKTEYPEVENMGDDIKAEDLPF